MSEQMAYRDKSLSPGKRTADLLSRMTLEEKVGQLCQVDIRQLDPQEWILEKGAGSVLHILGEDCNRIQELALGTRLGIPVLFGIDAIHGNAFWTGGTIYPTQLGLSSSWDPALLEKVARYTARETAATGAHWTFSPVICLSRDLRWGRVDETFGEDPFLIGELGKAMVRGYQGEDLAAEDSILACAKHFAGYSETQGGRDATEADLSRRKLLSLFLPPFKAVAAAGCRTFMAGYESIDGTPCSINHWLLTEILRNQWGFTGFVVSDWDNIGRLVTQQFIFHDHSEAAAAAVTAGNDMAMCTPPFYEGAIDAVNQGKLDIPYIDEACRRILKIKFELGLFDGKKLFTDSNRISNVIYCREHRELVLEAAYKSIVLLKNRDNILPLSPDIRHIAVIGPNADSIENQLGDWSYHSCQIDAREEKHPADRIITLLKGLRNRAHKKCRIDYAFGCGILPTEQDDTARAAVLAAEADLAILALGDDTRMIGEYRDRADLNLTGRQEELFRAVLNTDTPVVVVLIGGKPLSIPFVAARAAAIIEAWNPGMEGGTALAGLLFGDRSPEGKLTISFARHVGQQPVYYNQLPGWHGGRYVDLPAEPLFAFGYGLSYTSFHYSNMNLEKSILLPGDSLQAEIDIKNNGRCAGTEIVQLYIQDLVSSVTTPVKELKAFQRIPLQPGEKQTVRFEIPYNSLSFINGDLERVVEPGEFELMIGSSSRDRDLLKMNFMIKE